ncbi:MAG: TRAP transporter substrate-binding protein [Burkholderiaceae bacterium]|jgi:tripartite ATP-independent transporter DctP family solute receptor|nr:TRAP transporter substrate-binding protein [Burkholderiales bacterium]MCZ8108608.1 TRAP transporter substrate-binding protein [Burkholderiales bacterium]MCZ8338198.1 TRAP transporter substrate-binding protein [Burkholderiaceae bacterium]
MPAIKNGRSAGPRRAVVAGLAAAAALVASPTALAQQAKTIEWRYGHMNPPNSAAGMQAQWLAEAIAKYSNGQIKVTVYPSSQLGKLQELAEAVSTGTIALSHNTAGGIGSLHEPFGALDTPYLYRDVDHLMKVVDVNSSVMRKLNEGLVKSAGVRVLYAYYFGTRQLTANRAVMQPSDLAGQKIRAIPFPIYMSTVQGLGAVPVPVDWSEVPTALATGQVAGQENPVNVVLSSKLYETQSHMMLTGHIMNAQLIVINEKAWQGLSPEMKAALAKAADEVRTKATEHVRAQEADETEKLKGLRMKVLGPAEGLKLDAFKASVNKVVQDRFGAKFGELYKEIAAVR